MLGRSGSECHRIAASLQVFASRDLKFVDTAKGVFAIVEALGGIALGVEP
jgi:hypothetical protein